MDFQFLSPTPPSLYLQGMQIVIILTGVAMGLMDVKGIHLQYSKFNAGSSSSVQFSSRMGMLIFYAPAFLISTVFLFCKLEWAYAALLLEKLGLLDLSIKFHLDTEPSPRSLILASAIALHFLKRLLEVMFVHHYSGGIGIGTTIITSFLYSLYAAQVLYVMQISEGLRSPGADLMPLGIILFLVGTSGNMYHHYLLARLRDNKGDKGYRIPRGGLFEFVVCPHYLFEITSFLGMAFISQIPVGFCAAFMVFCYLLGRSLSTRVWYLKKFEDFPSHRKALIPFLI